MLVDKKINLSENFIEFDKEIVDGLIKSIDFMKSNNGSYPSYITCGSLTILSVAGNHSFSYSDIEIHKNISQAFSDKKSTYQGRFRGLDVYLDFSLDTNNIVIKYNNKIERDYKLGIFLDDDLSSKFIDTLRLKFIWTSSF